MRRLTIAFCLVCAMAFSAAPTPASAADIIVSAAASLTNALSAVAKRYEAAHPGRRVILNFSSAGNLIRQMSQGAPADVFCAADQQFMDLAQKQRLVVPATRRNFARNIMVLVVPGDSNLRITNMRQLASSPKVRRIALCNLDTTPLGREVRNIYKGLGLWNQVGPKLVIGQTVRQVLEYIVRGEVDAGFIFATDAMHAGMKVRVQLSLDHAGPFLFPAAVTTTAKNPGDARDFVAFLAGPEGESVLHDYGFLKP